MVKKTTNTRYKIHVKTGDTVRIISGKNKGETGEVTKTISKTGKIIVKNINLITKHIKPKTEGEAGQILKTEASIHSSKVELYKEVKE